MKIYRSLWLLLFLILFLAAQGIAQEKPADTKEKEEAYQEAHHGKSADELAKELANPNNSIAKLTFKNQFRWYTGDLPKADSRFNYTMLFQPVFPFSLGETSSGGKSVLFARPAFPLLVEQPVPYVDSNGRPDFKGVSGLGDFGFDLAYGVTEKSGFLWAFGMVGTIPTATDSDVAGKQFRLGPEAVLAKISKWGLIGVFPSHQFNVSGWSNKKFSATQTQWFLTFTPGGGWTVGSQPTMSYDWEAGKWTIPLHLTISKTVIPGSIPLKLEFELNYYVKQPDAFGPKWMASFNVTPIVSNFIERWIRGK